MQPPVDNRELYQAWHATGDLQCTGELPQLSGPGEVDWSRVEGMLLGLAIGDSLGNTTEGLLPAERRRLYGEMTTYTHDRRRRRTGPAQGVPSDDTQMAFWTLDRLNQDGGLVPERLAAEFASHRIRGIGHPVAEFVRVQKQGADWRACGRPSAGNGALMRIAPILVPHLKYPVGLFEDTVLVAALTHNDAASTACCVAFVAMLCELLSRTGSPEPVWWIDRYAEHARVVEGDETHYSPRGGEWRGEYDGPCWRFVVDRVHEALERDEPTLDACNRWYSGSLRNCGKK